MVPGLSHQRPLEAKLSVARLLPLPLPLPVPLPVPLPLPPAPLLLLLPTSSRPTLQVGVVNDHVDKELLVEVSSGAAGPALLPPLGGRVQFLDSKQLGAAP